MMGKRMYRLSALLFLMFFVPAVGHAHKVNVFAYVENGTVYTESRFSGNKPVTHGTLIVKDQKGNTLLTDRPDEEGMFSFAVPENLETGLVITIEAGTGHKGTWTVKPAEIEEGGRGKSSKGKAFERKKEEIKNPGILNITAGIVLIFASFFALSYLRRKKGKGKNS